MRLQGSGRVPLVFLTLAATLALGGCVTAVYHQLPTSARQDAAQTDATIQTALTVAQARDCIVDFETHRGDASVLVRPAGDSGWEIMEPPNGGYQDLRSLEIQPGATIGNSTVLDHGLLRWVRRGPELLANMNGLCARK